MQAGHNECPCWPEVLAKQGAWCEEDGLSARVRVLICLAKDVLDDLFDSTTLDTTLVLD